MGASKLIAASILLCSALPCLGALASFPRLNGAYSATQELAPGSRSVTLPSFADGMQQAGRTVRRHRIPAAAESAPPELLQAETALDKKDFAAAETLLRQLVSRDDGNYRAWFDLGFAYTGLDRRDDAIAAFRKSVAAKADVFESNLNLGLALADKGDPDAAAVLRTATRLQPSSHSDDNLAHAWSALGRVLSNRSPAEALDAFRQAATLKPDDPEPHLQSAAILAGHNDIAAAEREYQAALQLSPRSSDAIAGLANIYLQTKRLDLAESSLRHYLEVDPRNAAAHALLGRVLQARGKRDDAFAELERASQLAPDDPHVARELAFSYAAIGQYDRAQPLLASLVVKTPGDAELHYALGSALMHQHRYLDAQAQLLDAIRLQPAQAEPYGDLAVTANENKNYPLVIKVLDARARLAPETPATYFLRATAYDHLKQFKPASENYRAFLSAAAGKYPDQEWQAKHRLIAIDPKARK
jgi:Flp pilus assembly protein TadD